MSDRISTKSVCWLFGFLYIPYLYEYGYKYLFIGNTDFLTFHWAANLIFKQHLSPYTSAALAAAKDSFGFIIPPYLYPPPSLLVFYPCALLSYNRARMAMLVANHACVLLFIYLFVIKIAIINVPSSKRVIALGLAVIYVLGFHPIISTINNGQINLVVLVLLCATWYALKHCRKDLVVAVPLSLAVLMKTYPILLLPMLIIKKRYKAAAWTCFLLLLYAGVAYVVLPATVWNDWVVNVLPTGGYGKAPFNSFSPAELSNQSINGFLARAFTANGLSEPLWVNPVVGRSLTYIFALCVAGITLGLSYFLERKNKSERFSDSEISFYLLMIFLVAPLSWEHHLVYVLPAALTAGYSLLADTGKNSWRIVVLSALFIIAWNLPFTSLALRKGLLTLIISLRFYAVVILWVYFALKMRGLLRENMTVEDRADAYEQSPKLVAQIS